uniref:Uncharacterized protein n=1 Tax=Candidatus Kentrum sp. LPFa TaxID=2126335 RepID=A0A450W5E0_9GAMM|nr:MAG: hypothetical protein BECKLPF1236B_GA0070989_10322 [Candidatus Kentron sp. LPFa]
MTKNKSTGNLWFRPGRVGNYETGRVKHGDSSLGITCEERFPYDKRTIQSHEATAKNAHETQENDEWQYEVE